MLHYLYEVVAKLLDAMVETNKKVKRQKKWDALVAEHDVLSKGVMEKDKNLSLRECKHGKKHGWVQHDEILSLIQQKIEEQDNN